MKKIAVLLIALVLLFGVACADDGLDEFREAVKAATDDELEYALIALKEELKIVEQEIAIRKGRTNSDSILQRDFDDCHVEIAGLSLKEQSGNTYLIVDILFQNNGNTSENFATTATVKVYQNSVELDEKYFLDGVDLGNGLKDVRKGGSLHIYQAYKLEDKNTPLEIEIGSWIGFGDEPVLMMYDVPKE